MNKYLKNLNRIEFVVTTACSGKCKHCSQGDHKEISTIDSLTSVDAVKKIASNYTIDSIMTFGGESLLYPDTVCQIHKAATEMNILKRQLITNGYFSKNIDRIHSVATQIAESGVNDVLLSVDAFHQETIPLKYVIEFAKAIHKTGTSIRTQPAWLVDEKDNNPFNNTTREILDIFYNIGIKANEGNIVFPSGNALKNFPEYFDKNKFIKNPYSEDPKDIHAICFSANGDILGSNFYKKDILEILEEYRPK